MTSPVPDIISGLIDEFQQSSPLRPEETLTDTGNSFRFARMFNTFTRYLEAEKNWLVWDGTRLRRDDQNRIFDLTRAVATDIRSQIPQVPEARQASWKRWADQSESVSNRSAIVRASLALPSFAVRAEDLDRDLTKMGTPGGQLDLITGEVTVPMITDLNTRCTRVSFNPDLLWTPLLAEYVRTFVPGRGHWDHLMKVLGSCLRGGNQFRIWPIIHGPTTTGKSQLIETIAQILGDYAVPVNTSVFRGSQDDKPRPDLMRALTARLVYAEEASQAWELHGDHVKRMTGGDPITARGMRSNTMVEMVPAFTPIIICNDFPGVKGADGGVLRRIRALTFDQSVLGNEDTSRRAEFMSCPDTRTALFGQLVLGCMRAYSEGLDDMPLAWAKGTADAFDSLSHMGEFVSHLRTEGIVIEEDRAPLTACWGVSELHAVYIDWIASQGSHDDSRNRLNTRDFRRALVGMGWQTAHSNGTRWVGKVRRGFRAQIVAVS